MITIILVLPIYSADALAAVNVQITKNQGEKGIPQFIDAQGDVWTVEALLSGVESGSVDPSEVKVKIGANEAEFKSCTDSDLGVTCEYISPLTDGIKENEYTFQVVYEMKDELGVTVIPPPSNGDVIKADGSAPKITGLSISQDKESGDVDLDFTVNDKKEGAPATGIKLVEIINADTAEVLKTFGEFELGKEKFDFFNDGGSEGKLSADLFSGEGLKRVKIRAEDHLDHSATSAVITFKGDFVKPEIKDNLDFTKFGKFIGQYITSTDITIDIVESSGVVVKAYSDQAELDGEVADCIDDEEISDLLHCTWHSVDVDPVSSVSVKIVAKDEYGNTAEKTLSKSFTKDSSPPKIEFFGSERVYDDKSYIRSGKQRIILTAEEQGAGISKDGIRANLGALGKGTSEAPDECTETSAGIECYWETNEDFSSAGVANINLVKFEDNVGNDGEMQTAELVVDLSGAEIEKAAILGGEKDYVQSNDPIVLKMTLSELTGLAVLVDLNGIVMDAENKFPEEMYSRGLGDGWQVFTENDCKRTEGGKWDCVFVTEKVKSGPDKNLNLKVKVQDTAGNDAIVWPDEVKNAKSFLQNKVKGWGEVKFDLLGLADENNPDYWEVSSVKPLGAREPFVDLDTTPLTYARMPFIIKLKPSSNKVQAINVKLVDCRPESAAQAYTQLPGSALTTLPEEVPAAAETEEPAALTGQAASASEEGEEAAISPIVSRSLLYTGVSPEGESAPKPKIVLEFEPFDGREMFNLKEASEEKFEKHYVDYVCNLLIFSKVGETAIGTAELQEVEVRVPFGFSALGAQDENLDAIIKKEREAISTGFWGVITKIEEVMKWAYYVAQIAGSINKAINIVTSAEAATDGFRVAKVTEAAGIATCFGLNRVNEQTDKGLSILNNILAFFSCSPNTGIGWYDTWIGFIPGYYNELMNLELGRQVDFGFGTTKAGEKRREATFRPARNVRDNLYLSFAAGCLPGIIHNLDKYSQIKCRKIMCLENEVKAGLATVNSCNELEGLLTCKYFIGELWYILPFSQFYDQIIKMLWNSWKDPIALTHTVTILGCGFSCVASGNLSSFCNFSYWLWDIIDFINGIVGTITTIVQDVEAGGLNYCNSVGLEL